MSMWYIGPSLQLLEYFILDLWQYLSANVFSSWSFMQEDLRLHDTMWYITKTLNMPMTTTCLSLKFYPIMWCKSWFYSWYFGFAFYLGVYHKCHIPLCHWVVTLSHITRTSAMARDIFFPEKSISIEYYNFMNNACMHFLCKTCKAKPARKSSTRTVMLQFKI